MTQIGEPGWLFLIAARATVVCAVGCVLSALYLAWQPGALARWLRERLGLVRGGARGSPARGEPGESGHSPTGGAPEQKRCAYVFVFGGSFTPGPERSELVRRFAESNPHVDFSAAEVEAMSIGKWSDREQIGTLIQAPLLMWFMTHGMQYNPSRVLFNDYYDDMTGKGYVVAAYVF